MLSAVPIWGSPGEASYLHTLEPLTLSEALSGQDLLYSPIAHVQGFQSQFHKSGTSCVEAQYNVGGGMTAVNV